jgi:hypothetical protein
VSTEAPPARVEQWLVVMLVALITTCGIGWLDVVRGGSLSLKWFHGVAAALVAAAFVLPDLGGRLLRIMGVWGAFWAAWCVYLAAAVMAQVVNADPYFPLLNIPKHIVYSGVALAAAVAAFSLPTSTGRRALTWAAGATAGLGVVVLCRPLIASGVNPAALTWSAIRSGQPDQIIFGIFQRSFIGTEIATVDPVQANLRHGLASALALSIFLTALVRPTLALERRRVADAGIVAASLFLALTLSRAAILAVLIWVLIMALTPLVRGRAPLGHWVVPVVLPVVAVAIVVLPIGRIFAERFEDQSSAAVRSSNSAQVIEHFDQYAVGADGLSIDASPHNVVLDGLLAGGYVGAAAGVVLFGSFVLILGRLIGDHLAERDWALPFSRAATIGIGVVPVVRMVTAGGGLPNLAEWVGAGIFMGLVALERLQAQRPSERLGTVGTDATAALSR